MLGVRELKRKRALRAKIDLGEEQPRQILSGIAKYYEPSSACEQQVCVLTKSER